MSPEQGNNHGGEMLWKASLPYQDHSVTQDSKEVLSPRPSFTSKTHPPIPSLLLETPAQGNLSPRTTFHLDLSSTLPPAALNIVCGQSMVSPTEMKSLGKESRKQISCIEEKLTPKRPHRLSSGPLNAPVKDCCLVTPGIPTENTQSVAQWDTVKSVVPVPTVDGPNPVDPGTELT